MRADDIVADPDLAEGAVHVVDEDLGKKDRRQLARLALGLQPEQRQGGHRSHHVEAAVERVGHLAVPVPVGVAADLDQRPVERHQGRALLGLAEQALKEGQGITSGYGRLAPVRRCSYWRS